MINNKGLVMIKKDKIIILFTLVAFVFVGCSYKGAIRGQPMSTPYPISGSKYDLRTAVVLTNTFKTMLIITKIGAYDVRVAIYPKTHEILNVKLREVFSNIVFVDENTLKKDNYDLLIYPYLFGSAGVTLGFRGYNPITNKELFNVTSKIKVAYREPEGVNTLAMITSATLFLVAPITIPIISRISGKQYEIDAFNAIDSAANDLVYALNKNTELRQYAANLSYKITSIKASQRLPTQIEQINIPPNFNVCVPRNYDLAVVIGIEKYQTLPRSDYSLNDATLVKSYLKALGFQERNIEILTDERATRSSIEKSIEGWLPNRVKKNSKVFVYYSGHGSPDPSTGNAYIVPYDCDPSYLLMTGYPLKRLYNKLVGLGAKEVIVILDSCFSGAGGRSVLAKGARPLVITANIPIQSSKLAVISAAQGSQISTSSPEKKHGILTYYFLKAIKDGKKDLAEIYIYMKPLVEDEAKKFNINQTPNIKPSIEKVKGKFFLRN